MRTDSDKVILWVTQIDFYSVFYSAAVFEAEGKKSYCHRFHNVINFQTTT